MIHSLILGFYQGDIAGVTNGLQTYQQVKYIINI